MKEYLYTIVEDLVKELRRDGINLNVVNVHSYLNGSLHEPEYPKYSLCYKYISFDDLDLNDGTNFNTIDDFKEFVKKLENILNSYTEVTDIEIDNSDWSVFFRYKDEPDEYQIKDYKEAQCQYQLIQEHAEYIKTRYSELEQQDRDRHNARVLEDIEKLKKKLK